MTLPTAPENWTIERVNTERTEAIAAFGFTERQARFLVEVLLHTGVFVERLIDRRLSVLDRTHGKHPAAGLVGQTRNPGPDFRHADAQYRSLPTLGPIRRQKPGARRPTPLAGILARVNGRR
jgi:hypothetical protein